MQFYLLSPEFPPPTAVKLTPPSGSLEDYEGFGVHTLFPSALGRAVGRQQTFLGVTRGPQPRMLLGLNRELCVSVWVPLGVLG